MLLLSISPRLNLSIRLQRITIFMIPSAATIIVWPSCLRWWLRGRAVCGKNVNASFYQNFHGFIKKINPIRALVHYFYIQVHDVSFLHIIHTNSSYHTTPQYIIDTGKIGFLESEGRIRFVFLWYACPQEGCSPWIICAVDKNIFFTIVYMQFSGRNWVQVIPTHYILTSNSKTKGDG